jgi:transcriptional regulator with XRE-family HTH domain
MRQDRFQGMVEALRAAGLSYRDIGHGAHLSHATIHRIANGEARRPSYDTFLKIERLYEKRCRDSNSRD